MAGIEEVEGDYSTGEIPEQYRGRILTKTTSALRQQVRRIHRGLGHPSRDTMLRMMRQGGAKAEAIEYARYWQCPVCAASVQPGRPLQANVRSRPFRFNDTIAVDLKYLKDYEGKKRVILQGVDAATSWQGAIFIKTRKAKHVSSKLLEFWITHYGVPETIISDLGGEFEKDWYDMCEEYGIDSRLAAAHAPWQHGFAERHGKILGFMWDKVVYQCGVTGKRRCRQCLACCVQAKNATLTRNGVTPEVAVFGRMLRWPGTVNTDDDQFLLSVFGSDGGAWEATQMRIAAKIALLQRDVSEKLRHYSDELRKLTTIFL